MSKFATERVGWSVFRCEDIRRTLLSSDEDGFYITFIGSDR